MTDNDKSKCRATDVGDEGSGEYEQSTFDKIINTLLCRGDYTKQKLEARPVSLFQLFRFATFLDKILVAIGIVLAIFCGIGQPMVVLIAGQLTNILLVTKDFNNNEAFWNDAYLNVYIYAAVGVTLVVLTITQYICFKNASLNIARNVRSEYMRSLLRQDAGWFDSQKSGTITSQLNENIDKIKDGVGDKIGLILRGVTMFVTCIVIGFIYEWRITLVMIGMGPASAALMSSMARLIDRASVKQLKAVGHAGAIIEESIMNHKTVAACNGQETMIDRYSKALAEGRKYALQIYSVAGLFDGLFFLIMYIFFAAGFYYGAYLYKAHVMLDPGAVFIVANAILFGSYYLGVLSPHLMAMMSARVAAAVIYRTIDRVSPIDGTSPEGIRLSNVIGTVEFKNVHFSYPTRPRDAILNGLSWRADPGDTIALVGHSGCGKSTSIGLITRLYECTSGAVCIDGVDVRKFNVGWLRNIVGVVQQEPLLFNGTVMENIRLGNPDLTEAEIVDVCKTANAHDFIEKLNKGYETLIGAGGVQLSGGQKQRIAIARAIARNPRILLLDEATSALDAESEIVVQNALKKASMGRTTIVIAHRLSTLRDASQIIVFNHGKVAEIGTHKELAEKDGGIYAALVQSQKFKEEEESCKNKSTSTPEVDETLTSFERANCSSVQSSRRKVSVSSISSSHFARCSFMNSSRISRPTQQVIVEEQENPEHGTLVDEKRGRKKKYHEGLWQLYTKSGNFGKLITATVLSAIRGMELPAYALIFKFSFNGFASDDENVMMRELLNVFIAYIALGFASLIALFSATFSFGWAAESIVDSLRLRALRSVLYQDASYFDDPHRSHAIIVTRISTDAPNIKAALDSRMMQIVNNFAAIIAMVISALIFSWEIGLLGTACLVLLVIGQYVIANRMQHCNDEAINNDRSGQLAIEIVEQVRTIQLLTREEHFHVEYDEQLRNILKYQKKSGPYEALLFAITSSFMYFSDMASYALGISLIYYGLATPANVFTAAVSITTGGWALIMVSGCLNTFILAAPASDSLFRIINAESATGDIDDGQRPNIDGKVEFKNVHFSYPARPNQSVLKKLSFMAFKGQTVAIVGPSGSGKSTVISLLERFYQFNDGHVKVDGNLIPGISLRYLREHMALVGQEPVLFHGTIAENILLGTCGKTMEDVRSACKMANAQSFIEAAPMGYDTEVGERGAQLSGGQKQRIAIARALIRNPKILLLDEATSALDADSERAVQEALDKASAGRTCITVAHRLSSIQFADHIFFVENGKVAEHGTHQELIQLDAKYADLIRKQDLKS
uniref:p-glycoprotein 11.2 n=1 Tax=Parascaris univalens TaxID=6257 RepID=A0A7H9SMB9_PARUN|nr:P-glycoprotein 11.2 [Parascaris univalens]